MRRLISICNLLVAVFLFGGCSTKVVTPTAAMFTGEAGGCGDFHVYRYNDDRTVALFAGVDASAVPIDGTTMTLKIEDSSVEDRVRVGVYQWAKATGAYFCNDVAGDPEPIAVWQAVSGTISATRTFGAPPPRVSNATHKAKVIIEGVVLVNQETGEQVTLKRVELPPIWVGWLAG